MQREFEIFKKASSASIAVKRGFSWPGFFLSWIWAFSRGLWVQGTIILAIGLALGVTKFTFWAHDPILYVSAGLLLQIVVGLKGNSWRSEKLERAGYEFEGLVSASSVTAAISAAARKDLSRQASIKTSSSLFSLPGWIQKLLAISWLTWKSALRFKLFLVLATLLLAAVIGLPLVIQDDGTARGFTQILLTYTLSVITALLGLSTLWLACGTLARDIEECQIQMVAVKPIARWQIWLGKWIGIMTLNLALLTISGVSVYALMQWRSGKLPPKEQEILKNEIFVARSSAKEASLDPEIDKTTDDILKEQLEKPHSDNIDIPQLRNAIRAQVKASGENVAPGGMLPWVINLGLAKNSLKGQPLFLRVKFHAAQASPSGTFNALWQVGVPETPRLWQNQEAMSLAADTFHEFEIPPDLFDEKGNLNIWFLNANNTTLAFPLEDGMEVLYREGGFELNFARGLGIIFCWMALLAALGLASASFLSFPVAAFLSLGILVMAMSSGTLATVVSEGTYFTGNSETGASGATAVDSVVVPIFRAMLDVINLAKNFSPIDALSTGRSITWIELLRAFGQIVCLLGGIIAASGIFIFNRRELATAQGTQ